MKISTNISNSNRRSDGRTQVDDGSIGFDLVSFQNDGTGADEKQPTRRVWQATAAPTKKAAWVGEKLIHGLA